jgi:hypothetical protein
VVCFVAGALSLRVWTAPSWRFQVFVVSLAAMWLFLLGRGRCRLVRYFGGDAVALRGPAGSRALHALARCPGQSAAPHQRRRLATPVHRCGLHADFLVRRFVIVSAMDLGAPVWLAVVVAVAGVAAGILALRRVKATLGTEPANR